MRARRAFARSRRGTTAVEFALILPVFLLFYFGIIQWGLYLFQRNGAFEAARDACRMASTYEEDEDRATIVAEVLTDRFRSYGVDCAAQNFGACEIELTYIDGPPDVLRCDVLVDYRSPINFVPSPRQIRAAAVAVVETEIR